MKYSIDEFTESIRLREDQFSVSFVLVDNWDPQTSIVTGAFVEYCFVLDEVSVHFDFSMEIKEPIISRLSSIQRRAVRRFLKDRWEES